MTDKYKWSKEYHEGREAAQSGKDKNTNPYYSIDYSTDNSDEDMVRSYHWSNGWWDATYAEMRIDTDEYNKRADARRQAWVDKEFAE